MITLSLQRSLHSGYLLSFFIGSCCEEGEIDLWTFPCEGWGRACEGLGHVPWEGCETYPPLEESP